jgi:hypothetical protein
MKLDTLFLFSWRKLWIIIVSGFLAIFLHNLVSVLLGVEEAFFFIIAVFIIPAYIFIFIIYNLIRLVQKK